MSGSAIAPFDWPRWRADVLERLDRRSIAAASAFAAAWAAMSIIHIRGNDVVVRVVKIALFSFSPVMVLWRSWRWRWSPPRVASRSG